MVTQRSTNHQKMTSLPLFGRTEVALGDSTIACANDLQMQKFKLFLKLDRNTFPMGYFELNLAKGKASKSSSEVILCTWLVALRIEPVCSKTQISPSFLQVDFFSHIGLI